MSLYLAFAIPRFPISPVRYKIEYMHQRFQRWLRNCFIQSVELETLQNNPFGDFDRLFFRKVIFVMNFDYGFVVLLFL